MNHQETGKNGEDIAWEHLRKKGYELLERNYRKRFGEIDLIARDPATEEIVFAEVKLRKNERFGAPEASITPKKWQKMVMTAERWLQERHKENEPWRMDLIAILMTPTAIDINHLKNISL